MFVDRVLVTLNTFDVLLHLVPMITFEVDIYIF